MSYPLNHICFLVGTFFDTYSKAALVTFYKKSDENPVLLETQKTFSQLNFFLYCGLRFECNKGASELRTLTCSAMVFYFLLQI